jgi:hypothetical protein
MLIKMAGPIVKILVEFAEAKTSQIKISHTNTSDSLPGIFKCIIKVLRRPWFCRQK